MNEGPLIELKGISKKFVTDRRTGSELTVLHNIDIQVSPGEFTVIVGPSGAGKTSLLYILGALDRPSSGDVFFRGRALAGYSDKELAEFRLKHVGFVFQNYNLIPTLTALENVAVTRIMSPELGRSDRALELLEQVGLTERTAHLPTQLSGGEQQRVAIARALFPEPAVLLADEPTGNLDSKAGEEIIKLFKRLNNTLGTTVVVVTHNEKWAKFADRKIEMMDGSI